jgi:alpha-1,2-mannosyltransferase
MDAARSHSSTGWRLLIFGLAAVAVGILSVFYLAKTGEETARSAFVRWRPYLMDLMAGDDIYARHAHPNPPIMALLLYPFALLPRLECGSQTIDLGALAWMFFKAALTGLAVVWLLRLVSWNRRAYPAWAAATAIALAARPIVGDLMHGNVNLWILFLVSASVCAFARGRSILAGLGFALAAACKVTPALFFPYLLCKRSFRSAAAFLIGLPLFSWLVPAAAFGPGRAWTLFDSWARQMIVPYVVRGEVVSKHSNQSLPGLIHRLTTESPSFYDFYDEDATDYHNVASLDADVVRWIVRGLAVVYLAILALSCRPTKKHTEGWRSLAEAAVVVLGMLLFSERTWKHHAVTLLLPCIFLVYALAEFDLSRNRRRLLAAILLLTLAFMSSTSTSLWQVFGYRQGAKLAQVYGAYVAAYLLLLGGVVWLLRTELRGTTPCGNRKCYGVAARDA